MDTLFSYYNKTTVATNLIFVFLSTGGVLFLTILFIKVRKKVRNFRDTVFLNKAKKILNELIAEYEDLEDESKKQVKLQIVRLANRKWKKRLLADLLIHYNTNLLGDSKLFIKDLYHAVGLQKINEEDLSSTSLKTKIRAMRYLSEMRYKPAWVKIIRDINHRRKLLRVEASLALMFLTRNPLFFLDSLDRRLTQWQKINVYKRLKELPGEKIPVFQRWYGSGNKSVVLFALEMTGKFNQFSSRDAVARLLQLDDVEIQIQAIKTLVEIEAFEYADIFVKLLQITKSEKLTLELLKAVGEVSLDESHLNILKRYLIYPQHEIRFQASKAMLRMENGEQRLESFSKKYPEKLGTIYKHLLNPILN